MQIVAETVIAFNTTNRAFIIGDVEVLPQQSSRVNADDEFLASLLERGDFVLKPLNTEPEIEPEVEPIGDEPVESVKAETAVPKKATAKTLKGDE